MATGEQTTLSREDTVARIAQGLHARNAGTVIMEG